MGIFYQREELMPDSKTVVKSGSEKSISPAVIKDCPVLSVSWRFTEE